MDSVREFLKESNAIEGVHGKGALDDALEAWDFVMSKNTITLDTIKETHRLLMRHQPLAKKYIGEFRDCNIWIGGKLGMLPIIIRPTLQWEFCFETMRVYPNWKALHIKYEKIHPFADGNGRTGRIFMNWTRLKRCDLPILTIHEGEEQMNYYKWFD